MWKHGGRLKKAAESGHSNGLCSLVNTTARAHIHRTTSQYITAETHAVKVLAEAAVCVENRIRAVMCILSLEVPVAIQQSIRRIVAVDAFGKLCTLPLLPTRAPRETPERIS